MGTMCTPVAMARRDAPVAALLPARDARALGEHDDPDALGRQPLALRGHFVPVLGALAAVDVVSPRGRLWRAERAACVDDETTLRDWLNTRVGKTQRLAALYFVDELPHSAIGKVLKREPRDRYGAAR